MSGARIADGERIDDARGWRVAIAAMLCLVVGPSAMLVGSFGTFVGPLSAEFGWSRGAIGFAVSLMAIAIVFVAPVQGVLIDRFGARRIILLSIPIFAIGFLGLSLLPRSMPIFYAAWAIMPALAIGLWPVGYLKAVSGWFRDRLGLAIGVANAGIGIGTIVMPPIAARLIQTFGVRGAFVGMAMLALAALPLAWWMVRERAFERPVAEKDAVAGWTYRAMFRQREWAILAGGFFLLGISGTGLIANLVPILVSKGIAPSLAVIGMSLFGVAALTGRIVTGWLLDRYHAVRVANAFAAVAGVAMLVLAAQPPVVLALGAAAALGFISGAEFDVLAYTLRRYFGPGSFGKMYGAIFSAFQLGAGLGAALLAASVQWTGNYAAALIALAASSALFMAIFARLPVYPVIPVPRPS